jgi:DNA polymerase I-like protein with 3'-5' exonuclease and polymerase domains
MPVHTRLWDTMLAAYLLNPNRADQSLASVALEYLSRTVASSDGPEAAADWCQAADALVDDLIARGGRRPDRGLGARRTALIPVLARMECHGIRVTPICSAR